MGLRGRDRSRRWVVHIDGAIGSEGKATGLGVVVRDREGRMVGWLTAVREPMATNEAEYAALVFALESLLPHRPQEVHIYSDSEVVINQMRGCFGVHSQALRAWHEKACQLARLIPRVTFSHVPREQNRLADALANEALQGWKSPGEE